MAAPDDLRVPPLLVFADDWGRHPSSCQHLVGHLLDRSEVCWVNTIGMRPPTLDLATLRRGLEKVRQWRGAPRPSGSRPVKPLVLSPKMWPWFRSDFDRRLNAKLLCRQLDRWVRSRPEPPIALTTIPMMADLIGRLPVGRWVYYCVDDFSEWPGHDGKSVRTMEEVLARRADILIAAGPVLRDRLEALSGRTPELLTHGVDLEFWKEGGLGGPMPELDGLERPLIVFWGLIDRRIDVDYLAALTDDLKKGTVLLVGPESQPDPRLRTFQRLAILPSMPLHRLPTLAREASVLIMPYADLPVTRAMQPLKLKEYLATGLPAVVADLPSMRPWADCLDVAATPKAFAAAVRHRIETGLPKDQRVARNCLAKESWSNKASDFEVMVMGTETRPALRSTIRA
ncbi:hypothetical protein P12x_005962 (plasmid) [Tundrisphaera lichenicola]|uniref:hypothetical protein n=1 Tax=Tundrisphaera lichenicola TaxID=2029860 RepID=UPI003EBE8C73